MIFKTRMKIKMKVKEMFNLDGDDREHLDGDPVELVKASPGTSLGQSLDRKKIQIYQI